MIELLVGLPFLILASFCDVKRREIPDKVSIGLIISGIIFNVYASMISKNIGPYAFSAWGGLAMSVFAYLVWRKTAIGGGDVKILIGLGFLAPYSAFFIFAIAYFGLFVAAKITKENKSRPFAPFLLMALAILLAGGLVG